MLIKYLNKCFCKLSETLSPIIVGYVLIASLAISAQAQDLDVPYVPTPQPVVDQMLEIADVGEGDYVIDLGSGDGRIVISAVKRGAWGHGVDLNPKRIEEARANAENEGVSDRVLFLEENIFDTDFNEATVITMYLLNSVNRKLRPHLLEELEPGTRIVSHSFDMGDWTPDDQYEVESGSTGWTSTIYYWVIPAQAEGEWSWDVNGESFSMSVNQQYQEIDINLSNGTESMKVSDPVLRGKRIGFIAENGTQRYIFSGSIEDDTIEGNAQIYEGNTAEVVAWQASRQ